MTSKYKIINTEYIDGITSNTEFKKNLFSFFRENVAEFEEMMNNAIKNENYAQLEELAHKAKSSVKILGMDKQADDMKQLEFDSKERKNTETFKQRVSEFIITCYAAIEEIAILENKFIN